MARKTSEGVASNGDLAKASQTQPAALSDDQIAERAYFKWQERGCPTGDDLRDWLDARAELQKECEGCAPTAQKN